MKHLFTLGVERGVMHLPKILSTTVSCYSHQNIVVDPQLSVISNLVFYRPEAVKLFSQSAFTVFKQGRFSLVILI